MCQRNPQEPAKIEKNNLRQEVHLPWDRSSQDPDLARCGMKPSRTPSWKIPSDPALEIATTKAEQQRREPQEKSVEEDDQRSVRSLAMVARV
jgi:hypothetical protein